MKDPLQRLRKRCLVAEPDAQGGGPCGIGQRSPRFPSASARPLGLGRDAGRRELLSPAGASLVEEPQRSAPQVETVRGRTWAFLQSSPKARPRLLLLALTLQALQGLGGSIKGIYSESHFLEHVPNTLGDRNILQK